MFLQNIKLFIFGLTCQAKGCENKTLSKYPQVCDSCVKKFIEGLQKNA